MLNLIPAGAALLSMAAMGAAEPGVLGMDFKRNVRREVADSPALGRRAKTVGVNILNEEVEYLINVTIGTPPQNFILQLDTGSSDLWVLSSTSDYCQQNAQACQQIGSFDSSASSSFDDILPGDFSITYGDQTGASGDYFTDDCTVGGVTITNLTMGLAKKASTAPGLMGVGFDTNEAITQENLPPYKNIVAMLKSEGYINTAAYSLWLNDLDSAEGSILFGGIDTAKYKGELGVLPLQPDYQTGQIQSFTVDLDSIIVKDSGGNTQYSQTSLGMPVLLDSGTTLTLLPDAIANSLISGFGATNDANLGLIVDCGLSSSGATFSFIFGGSSGPTIQVSLGEFVIPITTTSGSQATLPNGNPACSFGINPAGSNPPILGDTFLRSAYVVYDLDNLQCALAQTVFNTTDTNVQAFSGSAIPSAATTAGGTATAYSAASGTGGGNTQAFTDVTAAGTVTATGASGTFSNIGASSTSKALGVAMRPSSDLSGIAAGVVAFLSFLMGSSAFLLF